MSRFRRFLFVDVGAARMRLALMLMPADLRGRTWRIWMLDRAAADEALAVAETIERVVEQERRLRDAAPFN